MTDADALRLLLIIDYNVDWARELYWRDIIDDLLALAPHATDSVRAGSDVLSLRRRDTFQFPEMKEALRLVSEPMQPPAP